jgi:hypothetical protein
MQHGIAATQQPVMDGSHMWLAALTAAGAAMLLLLSWYLPRPRSC